MLEADARIEGILSRYGMVNSRVSAYADTLPYNFEDRLEELPFHGKAVRFLSPSLEDIAVMKLYAWRPNDRSDLESPRVLERLDWARLDNLVNSPDEARASVLSDRAFDEMRHAYEKYRRQWHDKADV